MASSPSTSLANLSQCSRPDLKLARDLGQLPSTAARAACVFHSCLRCASDGSTSRNASIPAVGPFSKTFNTVCGASPRAKALPTKPTRGPSKASCVPDAVRFVPVLNQNLIEPATMSEPSARNKESRARHHLRKGCLHPEVPRFLRTLSSHLQTCCARYSNPRSRFLQPVHQACVCQLQCHAQGMLRAC